MIPSGRYSVNILILPVIWEIEIDRIGRKKVRSLVFRRIRTIFAGAKHIGPGASGLPKNSRCIPGKCRSIWKKTMLENVADVFDPGSLSADKMTSNESATIFNTDQGSQFTSQEWTGRLTDLGIAISMDGKCRWMACKAIRERPALSFCPVERDLVIVAPGWCPCTFLMVS